MKPQPQDDLDRLEFEAAIAQANLARAERDFTSAKERLASAASIVQSALKSVREARAALDGERAKRREKAG